MKFSAAHIALLFGLMTLMLACASGRKLVQEAEQYEEAKMQVEALKRYDQAYNRNRRNVDAHIGATRMAESLLNELAAKMSMFITMGAYDDALDMYTQAEQLVVEYRHLDLELDSRFNNMLAQARRSEVEQLYDEAEALVMEGNYNAAQPLIDRIYRLDRNHEKAVYLELMAELYHNYNKGRKALDLGLYREAFTHFKEVTDRDIEFKDAWDLQKMCKEKATFSLAYIPIHRSGVATDLEVFIGAGIKQHILQLNDPFIRLLDRDNLDELIGEQQQSMTALFDQDKVLEAGKLEGARYVLTGEVLSYDYDVTEKSHERKQGYLGRTLLHPKVVFDEYQQTSRISASFRYQLIDTETGEVFLSENLPFDKIDNNAYVEFKGDASQLYEGEWRYGFMGSRFDKVYNSKEEKAAIDAKVNAGKRPASQSDFNAQMMSMIGEYVALRVSEFSPE